MWYECVCVSSVGCVCGTWCVCGVNGVVCTVWCGMCVSGVCVCLCVCVPRVCICRERMGGYGGRDLLSSPLAAGIPNSIYAGIHLDYYTAGPKKAVISKTTYLFKVIQSA